VILSAPPIELSSQVGTPIAGRYLRTDSVHELSVDISRGETIIIEARCLEDLAHEEDLWSFSIFLAD
jgi:hypothetical protein